MQAPQNFTSAHNAPAAGAIYSNRAAVHDIFQNTGAFLDSFRTEFLASARTRHKETKSYMRNLHHSVQDMLAEMRQNREEATNGTRERLQDYMEDLHATVAGAMREADEELREFSRLRQKAAHELARMRAEDHDALCGNGRQQLEELADSRRETARSLHSELCGFTADLMDQVAQTRKQVRQELGFAGQAPVKAKAKRARASQSQARQEEPQKQSTPRKSMPHKAKTSSAAAATKASPVNAKRQAKAKKTVKAAAGAHTHKRRVH